MGSLFLPILLVEKGMSKIEEPPKFFQIKMTWDTVLWLFGFFFVVKFLFFLTKIGLGCLGWGHPISEKRTGGQECARTVGEPWERGKNRGKNRGRTVGGSKEPWENRGDFTKNRGRTVGTLQRTVGEPWGLYKEPWENRGDFTKNRGRTVGEPWGFRF